ncbi:MAG TPA: hypothetical protein VMP01_25610 [Pirellulaceae bacterium]|nr:hypothetical protein [Pirellulaceae bacterium]
MSRMLEALQNLSSRPAESPPAEELAAPAAEAQAAAFPDPALNPADHSRRMKELLVKHLAPPRASELLRNLKAEMNGLGGMTVPIPAAFSGAPPSFAFALDADDDLEPEPSLRESISVTFPVGSGGPGSIDSVENLLATIEEEAESPGEEIAVSFGSEEGEERGQRSEVRGQEEGVQGSGFRVQEEEERVQGSGFRVQEEGAEGQPPVNATPNAVSPAPSGLDSPTPSDPHTLTPAIVTDTPSPSLNPEPRTLNPSDAPAAASPLDHLADARPLVEYQPEQDEPPPAPAPLTLPPRTILRSKTRLEQRVIDDLAHSSRSVPFRELADRLTGDLRLLAGRCLLFAGIGPASHGDDLLAHLGGLMAEDEAEVLLVDADFTRAGLSVGLGALKETGLGELMERAGRGEELILPTLLPNVSVLPAGRQALSDSLGVVDHLAQLLARLQERFALILIDGGTHTQPLSTSLARLCDATYFVVRLGATDASTATKALKTFRGSGARVMGCVATTAGT